MQIVIPMSGIGKRFVDAGYQIPKPLIVVDGKPMIEHVVSLFPNETNFNFICNDFHLNNTPMESVLNKIAPNCKIYSVPVNSKKGPVDVVMSIKDHILDEDEVIVSYCDYGTIWNYNKFISDCRENDVDGSIPCYIGFHPHMLGNDHYAYILNEGKKALKVSEKQPFGENKMSEYASNGTYYFKNGKILKYYFENLIDSGNTINNEYYVSMVYNKMIEDNLSVSVFEIDKMLQWGTPYDLEIYLKWSEYFKNKTYSPLKEFSCPRNTTLIMPMAGKGSRFTDQNFTNPKPLISVDSEPMVVRAIQDLPKTNNIIFGILQEHDNKYNVKNILLEYFPNSKFISFTDVTKGQACTCEEMIDFSELSINNPILISACDNGAYYNQNLFQKYMQDENIDIIVWSFRNHQTSKNNPNMYAWLDVDENNFLKHVSCKKFIYDNPLTTHAIIGTMFFRKAKYFIDGLKKNYEEDITTNGEFYVDDVLNQNIKFGLKVKVFEVENYICWGTPEDYKTYNYWKEHFEKIYSN